MRTISEEFLSNINANIFLREFSFSENEFNPTPGDKVEFADHVVWIDKIMFVFQVKERHEPKDASEETERKWFEKKVIGLGIKQIRDTIGYLETQDSIVITNQRGHNFKVDKNRITDVVKIVIPAPSKFLPSDCWNSKYRISSSVGFVHIIPIQDYLEICRAFVTPTEINEYFNFREKISREFEETVKTVPESALIGQFLYGDFSEKPDSQYCIYQEALLRNTAEFDIMSILQNFGEHIDFEKSKGDETKYYRILIEFAKLAGYELREIKERISLSLQACAKNKFRLPYRTVSPNTGCGFVFIPTVKEYIHFRLNALQNLTDAAKYDQKLDRCIGISFAMDGDTFLIDWEFLEYPWKEDKDMDNHLKTNFPFRELNCENFHRYYFSDKMLLKSKAT
jgi:hypothetical protein